MDLTSRASVRRSRDPFDLDNAVVVVTGASSGLGARFARVLSDAGATVVAAARRLDRLQALASELPNLVAVQADVGSIDDCERLISTTVERFGRIDVLVNNAGTSSQSPAESESIEDFRRQLDINLTGLFALCQQAGRQMLSVGRGSIVNIASIGGLVATAPVLEAGYCASKGGVISLTRELAAQWASRGVRVNAIAPGWFSTELTAGMFESDRGMRWVERNTPMRRAGAEHELDGALMFFASDASTYCTGQVLAIDGGWTIR
jgi:NAD(P)-dependent dehydrogenase (short-subunit alcohol dehydrogenase family)